MAPKKDPKQLVTYFCARCAWDFTRTEKDKAKCTLCEKSDRIQEIKREPITQTALQEGMMRSMDRLMTNLQKAYDAREGEWRNDDEEIAVLQALAKAKTLEKHVLSLFTKINKKKRGIHAVSISI